MERGSASQLRTGARIADALVYAAGVAGVIAGGLLLQRGDIGFAVVAWSLTFVAGAGLRLVAWIARGVAELLVRNAALEDAVNDLRADRVAAERRDAGRHWGA